MYSQIQAISLTYVADAYLYFQVMKNKRAEEPEVFSFASEEQTCSPRYDLVENSL